MCPRRVAIAVSAGALWLAPPGHAAFQIAFSVTARALTSNGQIKTDVQTGGFILGPVPVTYEIEVRYRIADSTADTVGSRGLASTRVRVSFSGWDGAIAVNRTNLSLFQYDKPGAGFTNSAAPLNPDDSGRADGGDPAVNGYFTGLHGPFRDMLVADSDANNGLPSTSGFEFLAFASLAPEQRSWTGSGDPSPSNTNNNPRTWGVYSFLFTQYPSDNPATITVDAVPDALGNRFSYFQRTGSVDDLVPVSSSLSQAGTLTFPFPSPSAGVVLTMGLVVAVRRRR